jgi:hypothetical protein
MRNTADVTGGKPIAVLLRSISGVSAINPLVAVYDIHGGKVLFFYFVPDTTRDVRTDMLKLKKFIRTCVPLTNIGNSVCQTCSRAVIIFVCSIRTVFEEL